MNKRKLTTILSPLLVDCYDLSNSIAVVIDVFRATTTIITALHNNALRVIPVDTIEKTISIGNTTNGITAGEREGKIIPGLKFGNSSVEFTKEVVENKTLVMTTTNGTKLISKLTEKANIEIIAGAFINLSAVCDYLLNQDKSVFLICAGWKGMVNLEDSVFAGAIVDKIEKKFITTCDSSLIAKELYHKHKKDIPRLLSQATQWNKLSSYGESFQNDLRYASQIDIIHIVPIYINGELIISK